MQNVSKPVVQLLLLFIFACFVISVSANEMNSILVKTLSEDKQAIKAEKVKWWFSDTPETITILQCKPENDCENWFILRTGSRAITIHGFASITKKEDSFCWGLFEGQTTKQPSQKEIALTLLYISTVCK